MHNKILEAIQKGIQMGLEIQDDEQDQTTFQKSEITSDYHVDRANQLSWIKENFVDLGLPSGTLWCKWNIGATNGSTPESWYGNYYAWGEVETKENFEWKNYKHCNGSRESLIKYNGIDNKLTLDPEDDVVSTTLEQCYRMPTQDDIEELRSLRSKWVENYNRVKGLNGRVFTGNNGNKLFIPAAGRRYGSKLDDTEFGCFLWTSSRSPFNVEEAYDFYTGWYATFFLFNDGERYYGRSIRAVVRTH